MYFPETDTILWGSGFLLAALLLIVLISRSAVKAKPYFTAWIAFNCLSVIALFSVFRLGLNHIYFALYWVVAFFDLALQICVVVEVARAILRRNGYWVGVTAWQLKLYSSISFIVAVTMAILITPAAHTFVDVLFARTNLLMTILFCFMLGAVIHLSRQYGLSWKDDQGRVGFGLTFWILSSFFTDTLHTYWRTMKYFDTLEIIRTIAFQVVMIYWITVFSKRVTPTISNADSTMPEACGLSTSAE